MNHWTDWKKKVSWDNKSENRNRTNDYCNRHPPHHQVQCVRQASTSTKPRALYLGHVHLVWRKGGCWREMRHVMILETSRGWRKDKFHRCHWLLEPGGLYQLNDRWKRSKELGGCELSEKFKKRKHQQEFTLTGRSKSRLHHETRVDERQRGYFQAASKWNCPKKRYRSQWCRWDAIGEGK